MREGLWLRLIRLYESRYWDDGQIYLTMDLNKQNMFVIMTLRLDGLGSCIPGNEVMHKMMSIPLKLISHHLQRNEYQVYIPGCICPNVRFLRGKVRFRIFIWRVHF